MSPMRFVCLVLALCVTAACGDGNASPTAPTPTPASIPNVAGTYSGSVTITSSVSSEQLTGSMRMSVVQVGSQLTITVDLTVLGETFHAPAYTGTINATGFFTPRGDGSAISGSTDECGTVKTLRSTLTFSGNTARYVEIITSQHCGNLSASATLSR